MKKFSFLFILLIGFVSCQTKSTEEKDKKSYCMISIISNSALAGDVLEPIAISNILS